MREGIIPAPTQLRAGDYLYSEMENINQMIERFRDKLTELQEAQAHLNRSIIECKETVSDSSKNN
jgi:predicted  nucleic acid-binding Zn-ribbon protein